MRWPVESVHLKRKSAITLDEFYSSKYFQNWIYQTEQYTISSILKALAFASAFLCLFYICMFLDISTRFTNKDSINATTVTSVAIKNEKLIPSNIACKPIWF